MNITEILNKINQSIKEAGELGYKIDKVTSCDWEMSVGEGGIKFTPGKITTYFGDTTPEIAICLKKYKNGE